MNDALKGAIAQAIVDPEARTALIGQVKSTVAKFKSDESKAAFKQAMINPEARTALLTQLSADPMVGPILQKAMSNETKAAFMKQYKKKSKGNLKDQWIDFKYWMKIWKVCMGTTKPDKEKMDAAMMEYPWMIDLLKTPSMGKRYTEGRTGTALLMTWKAVITQSGATIEQLHSVFLDPENTILGQVMVPSQIYKAMGLNCFVCETPSNVMAMMDQHCPEKYLDEAVSHGLPDDTCTYTAQTPGLVLAGHLPNPHTVMVTSNLPCESGMASAALLQRELGVPTYRLDVPYNFKEEGAQEIYVKDMLGMIAFLEEHTGHKMDWDKLRHLCEMSNEMNEIEAERWEMNLSDTPPFCNDVLWFPHLCFFQLDAGREDGYALFKEYQKLGRKAYALKECSVKPLKYRAILWNPPSFGYTYFWSWLERCWGIGIVNDMETFGTLNFIDTSTKETMMAGLAQQWCNSAMSRHTRGPAENWMGDLQKVTEMYQPDFILNLNHMACRGSLGLTGAMIEWSKAKNLPSCIVDYNMYDSRVVSRQGFRDQINNFMINIMHAEPLDESLLVFDDDNEW